MNHDRVLMFGVAVGTLLLVGVPAVRAHHAGITTDAFPVLATGCNNTASCHFGGKTPAVVLSGPTLVAPNGTYDYVFAVHSVGNQMSAGLNVSADEGDFTPGGVDTQLLQNLVTLDYELTHTQPKASSGGVTTFSFQWTAPDPGFGAASLRGWGNAVDLNGASTGDAASPANLTVTDVNTVLCGSAPPVGTCATPGKSVLVIKSKGAAKQRLAFTWTKGPTTDPGDFGTPTATTDYAVCVYADSTLVTDLDALHGAAWVSNAKGFQYADTTAPMLQKMILAAGTTPGTAKVIARGHGAMGMSPLLPFATATQVTVEVVNSQNTNCWADTYTSGQIVKNGPDLLKAKH